MLGIEPLTSPMINQIFNQWTTSSKGAPFVKFFMSHVYLDTSIQDYEV